MGKLKKETNRQQAIPCAQDVLMQHETSSAKVCSGKAPEKTNTETNICCGISPTSLLSTTEMTLPNLTSVTSQTPNDPIHTDSTELQDLLHTDNKHLSAPSTKDKCQIKQKDKKHKTSDHASGTKEASREMAHEKSPSSYISEAEITDMSSASSQTAPTVTELSHITVQQNVTVTSTKKATKKHLDSYGTSKNRALFESIKPGDIISQSTECIKTTTSKSTKCKESITNFNFLQSHGITMPSQSTMSQENLMKTINEKGQRKSLVFDLGQQPEVSAVSTPSLNDAQDAAQTAGHTNQQNNEKQHVDRNVATKTEQPVNSLTMQNGASTEEDDVRTRTTDSTQDLLSNATNHGAQVSELAKKATVLSLTTNTEAQKVLASSRMSGNEALSVVEDNNTTEKMQVCDKAGIKEMPSKTTEVGTAKQHTSLDTSVLNISLPTVSKLLESTVLPNMEEPPKSPDVLVKQTETKKKCSSSNKWHDPADKTHVVEKVVDKTRNKFGDSSHKTQGTHEIDNTALQILKEMPVTISKPLRYNTHTFCMEDSDDTEDVQIPDKRPPTEKDEFTKNVTSVDKNLRSKRTAKANHKPVDSKDKQENKGIHKSCISIYNQFSNNTEQCKVTTHENKTDSNISQTKGNGMFNHADKKSKIINTDEETNKMFHSKESYNKVCKKKIKSVATNDSKIDMNTETSEKLKLNVHAQNTMLDFRSNPINPKISISPPQNVKRHKSKSTQNSITHLLVDESKKEAINDQPQQKKKKCRRNRGKNTEPQGNERNFRQEEYEANETCGCKEEKPEFQMDPETMKVKGKQHENLNSENSSETTLIKQERNETKSGDLIQANNEVSATLSRENLTHLTRTGLQLSVSCDSSERLPNMPHMLAPKPTNTLSTVDEEAEIKHKLIQRNVFLTHVCHVCKSLVSFTSSLKKCSNCKMISYCSKAHQKKHWAAHKDLCKVISKICKQNGMTNLFGKTVGISPDEYRYYRSHCINKCEKELGRELYLWEKEMICFPQVCHTCYESDTQKLTTCQKCHHVSYCKLSHLKTDHDIWCKEFQVYHDITLYQWHHGIIQPLLPDTSLQQYAPLTGDMKTFLLNTNTVQEKSLELHRLKLVALSDIATCPLTVLFSLQQCNFHLETTETLTIHLVGAEMQFEVETLQKWELFLLHLIPSLTMLKVVFIGPELKTETKFIQTLGKNKTCMKCNTAGRMVIYEFWKTLYHKFVMSLDYQKPDLICAFNAGLYRLTDFEGKDTWSPTIKVMLKEPDIPVVVTEYTQKELPFDIQRTQNIVDSLEILTPPTRNPFASLKPSLNFLSEETVPVIFKNFYITILQGEKQ